MQPSDDPQLARWNHAVALLSLDRLEPLWSDLGLGSFEPAALRRLMRELIVEVRQEYERTEVLRTDLGARAVGAVNEALGAEAGRRLSWWFRVQFCPVSGDAPGWSRWQLVFRHDQSAARGPVLSWPKGFGDAVARNYADHLDLGDIDHLLNAHDEPMTDWDLRMYARHGWTPGGSGADPMFHAEQIITTVRFQAFCRQLAARMSEELDEKIFLEASLYLKKLEVEPSDAFVSLRAMVARDLSEAPS